MMQTEYLQLTVGWATYLMFSFMVCGLSMQSLGLAVLGLAYTQQLDSNECARFLVELPHVIGFPLSCMMNAIFMFILSMMVYVGLVTFNAMWPMSIVFCMLVFANIIKNWRDVSLYKNSQVDAATRRGSATWPW